MLIAQPEINLENAARKHHEFYVPALITNYWLRVICVLLAASVLLLTFGTLHALKMAGKSRLIVVQPAQDGSFDRLRFVSMGDYRPGQKSIEHFALQWATKAYSMRHATIKEDFEDSLEFLPAKVVNEKREGLQSTHWIENFQNDASAPDIRAVVTKVRLEAGSQPPYKMTIDLDKHFILNGQDQKDKLEHWTIEASYEILPESDVPNRMIPQNPLGMEIQVLNETRGF